MKVFLVFLIFSIATTFVSAVMNGDNVAAKPYYARITYRIGNSPIDVERSGTIITNRFIITLGDANGSEHTIMAHVGSAIREHQTPHPAINWLTIPTFADAPGLIQLFTPLTFSSRVRPIRMIGSNQHYELPGVQGMVLGMTRPPQQTRSNLQAAFLRIVDTATCATNYPARGSNLTLFCAYDGVTRNDFCESDRGSPMTIVTREQEFLVGIALHGVCQSVPHIIPSLFIRISFYRSIIEDIVNNITNNLKAHQNLWGNFRNFQFLH